MNCKAWRQLNINIYAYNAYSDIEPPCWIIGMLYPLLILCSLYVRLYCLRLLTHWGRVTHICVNKLTIIGSDNGLSPGRRQAIIWTNAGILLIDTLGNKLQWNLNRNLNIFIQENAFENVVWKMAAILSRPQCVKHVNDRQWKTGRSTGSYMNRYILIEHISILCNYVYRYVCICVDMHARASAHMYIYVWVCIITHNLKCMLQHVMILPPTLLFIYIWIILYPKTTVRDDFNNIYICKLS